MTPLRGVEYNYIMSREQRAESREQRAESREQRAERWIFVLVLFLYPFFNVNAKGGPCSQYKMSCSLGGPGGSCTYYVFTGRIISHTIREMPFQLSKFRPAGNYCDLEAESQLSQTLREIPFNLGSHRIDRLPQQVTLRYRLVSKGTTSHSGPGSTQSSGGAGNDGVTIYSGIDVNGDGVSDFKNWASANKAGYSDYSLVAKVLSDTKCVGECTTTGVGKSNEKVANKARINIYVNKIHENWVAETAALFNQKPLAEKNVAEDKEKEEEEKRRKEEEERKRRERERDRDKDSCYGPFC